MIVAEMVIFKREISHSFVAPKKIEIMEEETDVQDFWIGSKVNELVCQLKRLMLASFDAL